MYDIDKLINKLTKILIIFSDIDISRAQAPKDISVLASEIGLLPNEVTLYGNKKAKISLNTIARLHDQEEGKYVVVAG